MINKTVFIQRFLKPGAPDFSDLPWHLPLEKWSNSCSRLEDLPRGLSRHCVVFVKYDEARYAIKELPPGVAEFEFNNLNKFLDLNLPVVRPVGHAEIKQDSVYSSILITRYLDHSIPYRTLFSRVQLVRYREHLLDAIAGLMVQLHLAGVYWGDCSLSNTLFKRDAGYLQAYLVDAETAEIYSAKTEPIHRFNDLHIMECNITDELSNLENEKKAGWLLPRETGQYIHYQYQKLWEEITNDIEIFPGEYYRVQERIRALNELGFSVGDIELFETNSGNKVRFHVVVTDRNYHHNQLFSLTGLSTEERQARTIMNEIYEVKTQIHDQPEHSLSIEKAAKYWQENFYLPTIALTSPYISKIYDPVELYCQILENKWYLSERAKHDVGHVIAAKDFVKNFLRSDEKS